MYSFELARSEDDAAIRRLLADSPVAGPVELTFEREPSFLDGCRSFGPFFQVLVARAADGLAGVATRSVRAHFVNGRPRNLGYLSGLRVRSRHQGRWVVSAGFRFLRELHRDGRVRAYLTTITEGNRVAEGLLVDRPRRGFPRYRELGRLRTLSLFCRVAKQSTARFARSEDLEEIVDFLGREGPRKQFFNAWTCEDFLAGGITPGFRVEDFLLLRDGGRLVGVAGYWDQRSFKQAVVRAYRGLLRMGRTLVGKRFLPAPGSALKLAYGAFVCVEENRPDRFRPLLEGLLARGKSEGCGFLVVGFIEGDPLLQVARRYPHVDYGSRLYQVGWEDPGDDQTDGRLPHVEVACL